MNTDIARLLGKEASLLLSFFKVSCSQPSYQAVLHVGSLDCALLSSLDKRMSRPVKMKAPSNVGAQLRDRAYACCGST